MPWSFTVTCFGSCKRSRHQVDKAPKNCKIVKNVNIIIISIQPEPRVWQEPEPSQATTEAATRKHLNYFTLTLHKTEIPTYNYHKEGRQCTYNLKFRPLRVTIVAVEKRYHIFWLCICSLSYPACKAHAPWVMLPSVACPSLKRFSTLSHKRHDLKKKSLNTEYEFWFYLQNLSEAFFILRIINWDIIINVYWSSCQVVFILVRF